MPDARTEAVEAMATRLLDKWVADHECDRSDDALAQATDDAETALDAIPTAVLARLVIERGGLVPVEGAWWDVGEGRHYDNLGAGREPWRPEDTPLYRLTEEPT